MGPGLPPITVTAVLIGLGVLAAGSLLAWLLRHAVAALLIWKGHSDSAARVFGGLTQVALTGLALGAGLTVVFPSVRPVDILGGVGVISIAAGIAFQTMLGNMFAGMVILSRDRFRVGDQISLGDHAGTVVRIALSSTSLRTFDGRMVVIPNGKLHSEAVTVQTGYEHVRTSLTVDLDAAVDLDQAREVALASMNGLPEVLADPEPQALYLSIGQGSVTLDLRFWSGARQLETREAQDAVIRQIMADFRSAGIALAAPTLTIIRPQ